MVEVSCLCPPFTQWQSDSEAGGAQNIGKKVKEKDQRKPSSSAKTGGFRGLRGIM